MVTKVVRTTLALPADLLEQVDHAVQAGKARSRNVFVATALRHELAAQEMAEIDAGFAGMADDEEYQAEALALAEGFSSEEWEAFRRAEADQ
jgi:metal-responsive CopG/Arc/MetJ family transcriptional regulator